MILVANEFTSDFRRVIEPFLRDNKSKFSFSNIVALRFNNKCLVSDREIPLEKLFAFNDHTICHSANNKIRGICDETNGFTTRELDVKSGP